MSEYINKLDAIRAFTFNYKGEWIPETDVDNFPVQIPVKEVKKIIREILPADVQPVVRCKDCQLRADIKDVNTGEMYHTCGALGFIIPDGFACNQGKRKGADTEC